MEIKYNNVENPYGMVTLAGVPNILTVYDEQNGTCASITLLFSSGLTATVESQYSIIVNGDSITSTLEPQPKNKRFYISQDPQSTAASVAKALRASSAVAAIYNVVNDGNYVVLSAKSIGSLFSSIADVFQTNIPTEYLQVTSEDGTALNELYGSKIDVDVFSSSTNNLTSYVTTLQKNFYGSECNFNMSPLLATLSEDGYTQPYMLKVSATKKNGEYVHLKDISANTVNGYEANFSQKYLQAQGILPLINNHRNNEVITLYTYTKTIPYSVLLGANYWSTIITCRDSAENVLWTTTITNHYYSDNLIRDERIVIPENIWAQNKVYYIDLQVGTQPIIRFNVIKPLKMSEGYQRVFWRNEYGGISFFDFTGQRTESDDVDIETYEKNVFDYQSNDEYEHKKIYKNNYEKSVTLTSHLIEESGKYYFNSLMRSKKVWTVLNDKVFYIIPKSISISEDQNYNNVYTCKLTYEYSNI